MKRDLQSMTTNELNRLIQDAQRELKRKDQFRAKELWGNVLAAIHKYQSVTGQSITCVGAYGTVYHIASDSTDVMGELVLTDNF